MNAVFPDNKHISHLNPKLDKTCNMLTRRLIIILIYIHIYIKYTTENKIRDTSTNYVLKKKIWILFVNFLYVNSLVCSIAQKKVDLIADMIKKTLDLKIFLKLLLQNLIAFKILEMSQGNLAWIEFVLPQLVGINESNPITHNDGLKVTKWPAADDGQSCH